MAGATNVASAGVFEDAVGLSDQVEGVDTQRITFAEADGLCGPSPGSEPLVMNETASLPFDSAPSPSSTLPSKVALDTTKAMSLPARQVTTDFQVPPARCSLTDTVLGKRALPIDDDSEVASDVPPQGARSGRRGVGGPRFWS